MPKFLEAKLKKEYGAKSSIPYKAMNSIGAMHGNKETAKGAAMEKKHVKDHLHTPHTEPHPGVKIDGTPNTGKLAGNMTPHKVHPNLIAHFEKGKGH
jgi:hypothetical protein